MNSGSSRRGTVPSSVRVLLVGPSGSGKSTLLNCFVYGRPPERAMAATIGAATELNYVHVRGQEIAVEWVEVGGSPAYALSRTAFTHGRFDGVLLVLDASADDTYDTAVAYMEEIAAALATRTRSVEAGTPVVEDGAPSELRNRRHTRGATLGDDAVTTPLGSGRSDDSVSTPGRDAHACPGWRGVREELSELPLLVIANKTDLAHARAPQDAHGAGARRGASSSVSTVTSPQHASAPARGVSSTAQLSTPVAALLDTWAAAMATRSNMIKAKLRVDVLRARRRAETSLQEFGPLGAGAAVASLLARWLPCCVRRVGGEPAVLDVTVAHASGVLNVVPYEAVEEFLERVTHARFRSDSI